MTEPATTRASSGTVESGDTTDAAAAGTSAADVARLLRSRGYLTVLILAGLVGLPIALLAYGFLQLATRSQAWLYRNLPDALGLGTPRWWPVPILVVAGLMVGLVIRYLPGEGGEVPADGFQAGRGAPQPRELPGVALAALLTLAGGAVLGPEAPLIALGGGLGAWAVRAVRRDAPQQAVALIGAAGSFAAISTLLGSPLPAAFLLMEIAGIGGAMTSVMLVPGLLAAGIGALAFVGIDSITGLGPVSLSLQQVPAASTPTLAEFGWALVIGVAAAALGLLVRRTGRAVAPVVARHRLLLTPVAGLAVALLAIAYATASGRAGTEVLFSGQSALGPLLAQSSGYSVGVLLLLLLCKGVAYGVSLGSFRGGPIFPAMFIGAVGGLALSHAPGLSTTAGAAMGIGAMCVAMLGFPLVSVLLATLLLAADGLVVMPLVIVAVVVSYVCRAWLDGFGKGTTEPPDGQPASRGSAR